MITELSCRQNGKTFEDIPGLTATGNSLTLIFSHLPYPDQAVSDELPKLFSDEEFNALQKQRTKDVLAANDIRGDGKFPTGPAATDGLPESTLEQQFPHVAQKLTVLWRSRSFTEYVNNLAIVDRGTRQGFPPEVLEDLMLLSAINEMFMGGIRPPPPAAARRR